MIRWARWAAVVLAGLAVIDPAFQTDRRRAATVAVLAVTPADAPSARLVAERLGPLYTVVEGPFARAAATVLVGLGLPEGAASLAGPVFGVTPPADVPAIRALDAPPRAAVGTRTPIRLVWAPSDGVGRTVRGAGGGVHAELLVEGAVVDRIPLVDPEALESPGAERPQTLAAPSAHSESLLSVTLFDLPTEVGVRPFTVRIRVGEEGAERTVAERVGLYEAIERPHPVLFHDPRPIWGSTFFRRALDEDLRFRVSARIRTSPGFATTWGTPPATLTDARSLEPWDLIVIGAAESLSAGEVATLERHLQARGGVVLLLLDQGGRGPWESLVAGASGWRSRGGDTTPPEPLVWVSPDLEGSPSFKGNRVLYPDRLPAAARSVAVAPGDVPAIWELPVGLGTLVVSGAVDTWQFRDPDNGAFEAAWRALAGWAAARVAPEVEIRTASTVDAPGSRVPVTVTLRRGDGQVQITGGYEIDGETTPFRLWPSAVPGRFQGTILLPLSEGTGVVQVSGEVDGTPFEARVPLARVKAPDDATLRGGGGDASDPRIRTAWFQTRGGTVVDGASPTSLSGLPGLLDAAIGSERRTETWHPMRSPWWLLVFVGLLVGEWAWRRRRGLP